MQRRRQFERDYSAQNARAKISTSPIFHAKVHALKFSRFLFSCFDRGSRKSRNFGPRENFPLYGICGEVIRLLLKYCIYRIVLNFHGSLIFVNFQPFAKIFQRKFLTRGMRCARAASSQTKSSKVAFRENLDPRNFSAIRYCALAPCPHRESTDCLIKGSYTCTSSAHLIVTTSCQH